MLLFSFSRPDIQHAIPPEFVGKWGTEISKKVVKVVVFSIPAIRTKL